MPVPVPGELVVWSGASERAAAEAQLVALAPLVEALSPYLALAPTVVESAAVDGLQPGYHVVALSFCPLGQGATWPALFDHLAPSTYVRSVRFDAERAGPPPPCPTERAGGQEGSRWEADPVHTHRAQVGGATFAATPFAWTYSEQGDFARAYDEVALVVTLVAADGQLRGVEVLSPPSDATHGSLQAAGPRLVWSLDYGDPPCEVAKHRETTVAVVRDALVVTAGEPMETWRGDCFAEERRLFEAPRDPP
jgi:hypothetical protein